MVATRARAVLATLWVGSLWTIGYIVAPALFANLEDRTLAGTLAGRMFHIEAWVSIVCAVLLAILVACAGAAFDKRQRKHILILIGVMLSCTLASHFGIQPYMAELRAMAGPGGVMTSGLQAQFGKLHGASSAIYMLQSVLGLFLIWKLYPAK